MRLKCRRVPWRQRGALESQLGSRGSSHHASPGSPEPRHTPANESQGGIHPVLGRPVSPISHAATHQSLVPDAATDRLRQVDPVGIAGGVNLYGFAEGDPVNYPDPFGLCPDPQDPVCRFALGGGRTPGVGVNALLGGIGRKAEELWDKHGDVAIEVGMMALTRGQARGGGFNSRTVARTTMGRTKARVDVELPGKHGPGNVHVQTKGPGGPDKFPISTPNDLSGLPRILRDNEIIRRGIDKAFDLLERFKP